MSGKIRKSSPERNPGRIKVFKILVLSIPLLFFLLLEVALRVGGYGGNTDPFLKTEWKGREYYSVNPGVVKRYFSREGFQTYTSRDMFEVRKRENAYRIFCLGASTTIGMPYMFNGSYSALLRDRLTTLFPDRHFEVINVGITAVTSYTVADLVHEILRYEPDLIILYTGHNEFYGALGIASTESIGKSWYAVRLYLTMRKVKTVLLIRDILFKVSSLFRGEDRPEGGTLMEEMAGSRSIPYGSADYTRAMRNFERNLRSIAGMAKRNKTGLLMSTVVSNLRDRPPFVSGFAPGTAEARRDEWNISMKAGRAALHAGDYEKALRFFETALSMDTTSADAQYAVAQCCDRLGNTERARRHYINARDFDQLRFRAGSDLNSIVRRVAGEERIPLVDMEEVFLRNSPDGIPDKELFWEHVHPTFDGYFLMAKEFCSALAAYGFPVPADEWNNTRARTDDEYRAFAGLTEFDHTVARLRIDYLTSRWPFTEDPEPFEFIPGNEVEKIAWEYLNHRIGWGSAHAELAKMYIGAGRFDLAEKEYLAIAKSSMHDPYYMMLTGDMQVAQKKHREAIATYAAALKIEESQFVYAKIALLHYELGEIDRSIRSFEKALDLDKFASVKFPEIQRRTVVQLLNRARTQIAE